MYRELGLLPIRKAVFFQPQILLHDQHVEGFHRPGRGFQDEGHVASEYNADLMLESEPGYVFLPQPMIDEYKGQHGSSNDSDMIIPMIMVGSGIPAGAGIEPQTDLRALAPLAFKLLGISGGNFETSEPTLLPQQDLSGFKN